MKTIFLSGFLSLSVATIGLSSFLNPQTALAAEGTFSGQKVSTLGNDAGLQIQPNRIAGTGSFIFQTSLAGFGGDSSHALSFSLKDGGSLIFSAYTAEDLSGALQFEFTRAGTALTAQVSKAGESARDISGSFSEFDASQVIDLQIDIHNSENPAHLLVWNALVGKFTEDTALFNSGENGSSPGKGSGLFRGFTLNNATIFKATPTKPKFHHEH